MSKIKKVKKVQKKQTLKNKLYDFEEDKMPQIKKVTKTGKRIKSKIEEEKYIGVNDTPKISPKKLKEIRKRKIKEQKTKEKKLKRLKKIQKRTNKERLKKEKINSLTKEQIRTKKIIKKIIKVILIFCILCVILIFFMLSPVFNIKEIKVEGNNIVSTEQIISLSQVQKETNIFKVSNKDTINYIKSNPYIDEIKIKRVFPDIIKFIVKERQVKYLLQYGSSYVYIDEQGYILEISAQDNEKILKINGYITKDEDLVPGNQLNEEDINKIKDVYYIMYSAENNGISNLITSININDSNNYEIYMQQEQKKVHLGDISNLDTKMLYIKVILEKEKEYKGEIFVNMDLNSENPYFREDV